MPKYKKKSWFRRLPKVRSPFGCCTSTDAVKASVGRAPVPYVEPTTLGNSEDVNEAGGAITFVEYDAPQIEVFKTQVISGGELSRESTSLSTIEEEVTEEELEAREVIIRFFKTNKARITQISAERTAERQRLAQGKIEAAKLAEQRQAEARQAFINTQAGKVNPLFAKEHIEALGMVEPDNSPRRVEASNKIAAFLKPKLAKISADKKQTEQAAQKRAYIIKIAKRVLMVVVGIALIALGAWIIKSWLAVKAAETAAVNLAPAAPIVPPVVVPSIPGFTPALDTAIQNMPALPLAPIPTPVNGLDAEALRRISIYMGA